MFKRIKNLLTLSKYTVAGQDNELVRNVDRPRKLAKVLSDEEYNPLNEFSDETIK